MITAVEQAAGEQRATSRLKKIASADDLTHTKGLQVAGLNESDLDIDADQWILRRSDVVHRLYTTYDFGELLITEFRRERRPFGPQVAASNIAGVQGSFFHTGYPQRARGLRL
jgi:hypothetical protein